MLRELRDWAEELACRAGVDTWPPAVRRAAAALAVLVLAGAVWRWGLSGAVGGGTGPSDGEGAGRPSAAASEATAADKPSAPASVTVHVVGAVRRPGVYVLAGGSRAGDAIAAAGGLLGNADQAAVNLARVVADGEQIAVPVQGVAGPGAAGGIAAGGAAGGAGRPGAGGKVDLNTATAEQLDALPGVGPATAAKIVADRTENGPFRTPEDLMRVPGIGAKKFDALKDLVTAG